MPDIQTTGHRREVGAELKRYREECDWPAYQLADKLGWSASLISRSEAGKRRVTEADVAHYLGMCGVADDKLQELLALVREPDDYRLQRHLGRIPDELRALIFFETTAEKIFTVEPVFVPGLLQTAAYTRALFQDGRRFEPSQIEGRVQIRMNRQAVLARPEPPRCLFFVHECALRAPVGSPAVMYEQMLQLLLLGSRVECAIRVIPISAGATGMIAGSFHIFHYEEDPPLVYVQHETTSEFLETVDEVATYQSILNRVASVALDGQRSREFLAMMASDYERQGARHGTEELAQE